MSGITNEKEQQPTEAELHKKIDTELETAADEAFGTEEEIQGQAVALEKEQPAAAEEKTPEQLEAEAKAAEEKTPEQLEAEAKAAEEKTPEQLEAEAKEEKPAGEKTAEELAADEASLLEIPEDMKGRTRERFEKLTTRLRENTELVAKQKSVIDDFRGVIEGTGLSVSEVQKTLALGSLMKSNPTQALETLNAVVKDLSSQVGVVPPGEDALAGFDDLKQQVADRELSMEHATTIAKSRIKTAADDKRTEVATAQQTEERQRETQEKGEQEAFTAQVGQAQAQVAGFLKTIEGSPDYEKVAPRLVDAAKFAAENLAPEKWLGYISGEHKKIMDIASAVSPGSGGTPILNGGAPNGGQKEPQNMEQLADTML